MPRRAAFVLLLLAMLPSAAGAIPAFARRYRVSCTLCHAPVPALNAFGDLFAANGFRMSAGEASVDTIGTGDPLLHLASGVPLAVRVDAYVQAYTKGRTRTDFGTPYNIKLLASGPLSRTFSYYMYVNLYERGEFGGFEDALLIANDVGGRPVDVALGQFQVSDPLFKRELRLEFEDYAVYRVRVGDEPANLTYDRGLMVSADVLGFALTGQLLNGNGIGPVNEARQFDDDGLKTLAGHLSRDLSGALRVGVFGYLGRSESGARRNRVAMAGADVTLGLGAVELNAQALHREDTDPLFGGTPGTVETDGGFLELLLRPPGSRWHGFALYNLVTSSRPLLAVGLGGPAGVPRYETASGGIGYLALTNLKILGEASWDLEQERARLTVGFVTAF